MCLMDFWSAQTTFLLGLMIWIITASFSADLISETNYKYDFKQLANVFLTSIERQLSVLVSSQAQDREDWHRTGDFIHSIWRTRLLPIKADASLNQLRCYLVLPSILLVYIVYKISFSLCVLGNIRYWCSVLNYF